MWVNRGDVGVGIDGDYVDQEVVVFIGYVV